MRKFNQIVIALIVLISTIGFASATLTISPDDIQVNVIDDTTTVVTVTYEYDGPYPNNASFEIKKAGVVSSELIGSWISGDWTAAGAAPAAPQTMGVNAAGVNKSTWTFYIMDGDDTDIGQVGLIYGIYFSIDGGLASDGLTVITGSSTTLAHAVPEFPTIALPIAAILGLAFIIQRRREEE